MYKNMDWNDDEVEVLYSYSEQIALALGNSRLRQNAEELAMLNERDQLARDLHDAVTQTLFSASLLAEAFPSVWENNPRQEADTRDKTINSRGVSRNAFIINGIAPICYGRS